MDTLNKICGLADCFIRGIEVAGTCIMVLAGCCKYFSERIERQEHSQQQTQIRERFVKVNHDEDPKNISIV